MKSHTDVLDCLIVGIPDAQFGEVITAVIQLRPEGLEDPQIYQKQVRNQLAAYKVPRYVVFASAIFCSAAGKADYQPPRVFAEQQIRTQGIYATGLVAGKGYKQGIL